MTVWAGPLPRHLHPGAWWLWALGLATAASRTTNPLLLLGIAVVAGYVVAARRTDAPWARAYRVFLVLALVVLAVRLVLQVLFGGGDGATVLVALPEVPLPGWMEGVTLGGAVTAEGIAAAVYDGLRLAALLLAVGAANSLANPSRLLRTLPAALYEAGLVVTVAMTFTPQAVVAVGRVRAARRLRAGPGRAGRRGGLRGLLLPVLESSLERSLELAAAMDSRGYGRRAHVPAGRRRITSALTLCGLLAICVGLYGLLDAATPPLIGLPLLAIGAALALAGLLLAGRRTPRSRYRPDRWRGPEIAVAGCGLVVAAAFVLATGDPTLSPSTNPLVTPGLPALPVLGLAVALLPAWLSPAPPQPRTGSGDRTNRAGDASGVGRADNDSEAHVTASGPESERVPA